LSDFAHDDAALDEALMESFPASDPVAISFPGAVTVKTKSAPRGLTSALAIGSLRVARGGLRK
jgi:hypothetical protein